MCTNFVPSRSSILNDRFGITEFTRADLPYRDEAYPGYLAPMIRNRPDTDKQCVPAVFGLIPSWSKDGKNYRFCYNARSETVAEKPSFRSAWRRGQFCIVPVDAFYEPSYESGKPVRWKIERTDGAPMGLAGIWEVWKRPEIEPGKKKRPGPADLDLLNDDWAVSFSLLTVNATNHSVMNQFHRPDDEKRSVVILDPDDYQAWLNAETSRARDFLHTIDPGCLQASPAPAKPRKQKAELPAKPVRKLI